MKANLKKSDSIFLTKQQRTLTSCSDWFISDCFGFGVTTPQVADNSFQHFVILALWCHKQADGIKKLLFSCFTRNNDWNNRPGLQKTGFVPPQTKLFVTLPKHAFFLEVSIVYLVNDWRDILVSFNRTSNHYPGVISDPSANHKSPNLLLCKSRDLPHHLSRHSHKKIPKGSMYGIPHFR